MNEKYLVDDVEPEQATRDKADQDGDDAGLAEPAAEQHHDGRAHQLPKKRRVHVHHRSQNQVEFADLERHGDEPVGVSVGRGGLLGLAPGILHVDVVPEGHTAHQRRDADRSLPLFWHFVHLDEEEDGEGEHGVAGDPEGGADNVVAAQRLIVRQLLHDRDARRGQREPVRVVGQRLPRVLVRIPLVDEVRVVEDLRCGRHLESGDEAGLGDALLLQRLGEAGLDRLHLLAVEAVLGRGDDLMRLQPGVLELLLQRGPSLGTQPLPSLSVLQLLHDNGEGLLDVGVGDVGFRLVGDGDPREEEGILQHHFPRPLFLAIFLHVHFYYFL
mmetsp:Transcript_16704/g.41350  ORF Transcript_16704/g.41350 Transcript_16704/m.41350 type:complete len:328 (-) Transcript_16704:226-1209(-)